MMDLTDKRTGKTIHLALAHLTQTCNTCGAPVKGTLIFTLGDGDEWRCGKHLFAVLAKFQPLPAEPPAWFTAPVKSAVHHVTLYRNGNFYGNSLETALKLQEAQGRMLFNSEQVGEEYIVLMFIDVLPEEVKP